MISHKSRSVISPFRRDTIAGTRSSPYLRTNRSNSVARLESGPFVRNRTKEKPVPSQRRLFDRTSTSPDEFSLTPIAINKATGASRVMHATAKIRPNTREIDIFASSVVSVARRPGGHRTLLVERDATHSPAESGSHRFFLVECAPGFYTRADAAVARRLSSRGRSRATFGPDARSVSHEHDPGGSGRRSRSGATGGSGVARRRRRHRGRRRG